MSTRLKVIFVTIITGFTAAAIFVGSSWFGLYLVARNIEIPFLMQANPLTPFDFILVLLCLFAALTSIAACPYATYRMRKTISDSSQSNFVRAVSSTLMASSQMIFLAFGYFFLLPAVVKPEQPQKPDEQTIRREANNKIIEQLSKAEVKIVASKAEIISDNGDNITAEITLQTDGVPQVIPRYELQIQQINLGRNFQIGARQSVDSGIKPITVRPVNIEADNENGKWIFYQGYPKKFISDNSREITFRLDFFRLNPNDNSLPTTISPELKIRPQETNDYFSQMNFFYQPIPINFQNAR